MHDASAMKTSFFSLLLCVLCLSPLHAQEAESDSGIPPLRDLPDFDAEWIPEDTATTEEEPALPEPNQETINLILKGISLQKEMLGALRSITDRKTADAASREIRRIAADLKVWGATLDARPIEDEIIMGDYEVNFLPEIRQISADIRREGERLGTYSYFGSKLLYESLTELIRQAQ